MRVMEDLQFTIDVVKHDLRNMDAIEANEFLSDNFNIKYNECDNTNFNNGVYCVYVSDLDLTVIFNNGKYCE